MGIKMAEAYSGKLNKIVSINEVNKKNREQLQLKCPYKGCRTGITYTEEHIRTYNEKSVSIPAYFRLISEDNSPHSADCIYSTFGELVSIAKRSKGMLESIQDNLFEFRLQVITKTSQGEKNKKPLANEQSGYHRVRKNNNIKTAGTKSAYLSTIKKILELKSKMEEENHLQKSVVLKDGKKTLNWGNFYFDIHDYYDCYSLLESGAEHPICIEGIIKHTKFIQENGFYKVNMELYRLSNKEVNDKTLIPSVFINFHGRNLYRKVKEIIRKESPSKVVVYSDNIHINSNVPYLNINPKVYDDKQMHLWN